MTMRRACYAAALLLHVVGCVSQCNKVNNCQQQKCHGCIRKCCNQVVTGNCHGNAVCGTQSSSHYTVPAGGPPVPDVNTDVNSTILPKVTEVNVALSKHVIVSSVYRGPPWYNIYDGAMVDGDTTTHNKIWHSQSEPKPFAVVDLGAVFPIKKIRIWPRLLYFPDRFLNISIRVGITAVPGPDFSSYTEIFFIPGPPSNPVTMIEHILSTPINGRYVSVQRTANSGTTYLEITELQVIVHEIS